MNAPAYPAIDISKLSGFEVVQGLSEGRLKPPAMREVIPFDLMAPEKGRVVLRATPAPKFYNPTQTVHGGWSMTLLDTVMYLAAQTLLPAGATCPTHETTAKFLKPITAETGELTIIGTVLSAGRTMIALDGRIEDGAGRLLVHGTSSCFVRERAA